MQKNNYLLYILLNILVMGLILPPGALRADQINSPAPPGYGVLNLSLLLDEKEPALAMQPFINNQGWAMIRADVLADLLSLQLDWADNNQLQLARGDEIISLRANELYCLTKDNIFYLDTPPVRINSDIYIPLRPIAEEFGLTVGYDAAAKTVMLFTSPPAAKQETLPAAINFPQDLGSWGEISAGSELAGLWQDFSILGGYYTRLNNSPANRTNNIIIACRQIDGSELKPDETFSFNGIVGPRSREKGYLSASIFVGRQIVPGIGGGICQLSSTLYNTALGTGLVIIERYPHSLPVNYIAPGRDATVLWGGADLKFRNNQDFGLKILTGVYGHYVVAVLAIIEQDDQAPDAN